MHAYGVWPQTISGMINRLFACLKCRDALTIHPLLSISSTMLITRSNGSIKRNKQWKS